MAYTSSVSYMSRGYSDVKYLNGWQISGGSVSGGSSSLPASQQQFPTSAYGQVVPVIWGKARVPGGYIWAPDIIVRTTTTGAVLQTTTVKVLLNARIRFARPLVADSSWRVRRIWADGVLLYNASNGYKKSGFNFREYDGRSTQGRDPTMVDEEGESNVSAHRGYLDIVVRNYNLGVEATAPPAFEAEWVQDPGSGVDTDVTTGFFSNAVNTYAAPDWDNGQWYGISTSPDYLRRFDIGTNQEVYAVPLAGVLGSIIEESLQYIPEMEIAVAVDFVSGILGGSFPCIIDPATGGILAHSSAMGPAGQNVNLVCSVAFSSTVGVMVAVSFNSGYLSTHRFTADSITRTALSATAWDGRGVVECIAIGDVRASDADLYMLAGDTVYKCVINSTGQIIGITELYTDADDLVYCVFHDSGLIVWNDNLEVMRVNVSTGAVEWTETVPFQIPTSASSRALAPPHLHRLDDDIMLEAPTSYNFIDLDDGSSSSIAKVSTTVGRHVYDGVGRLGINTDRGSEIARIQYFDTVGDGDLRNLEDFLVDLMVAGGFDQSEIEVENVDDQIQGAVIDITSGVRDTARQVCEPYSIAIFERADQIIFKRALTDGLFAVDATISATGDLADQGGQAIRARRLNPEEFVASYGINYRDADEIYQARPQRGEIPSLPFPVAPTDIGVAADIPIISDADTIKVLATKKVNRLAIEKHEFEQRLRAKFADLEPEDITQFTIANRLVTARVFETTINPDFTNTITCTEFLSSVSVSISGGTGRPVDPEPAGTEQSRYYHLDIPLMTDTHDTSGASLVQYHVLASAGQPYWDGATLYRKDGSSYIPQASQVENGLVGIALTALPDWDIPYVTEFAREITVAVISGDTDLLTSATYQEVCEGANMFAIGQPGRWEICHVIDITDNGDNTYTFTGLRRGRGTSEEFTGLHDVGDFVVWLSDDNVQRLEYALDALNDAFDYKPVGFGGDLATTIAVNRTVTGEAEKIPKPCQLDAEIDGADIDLSWVRRSRIGPYWADDGEDSYTTPLGESLEQYVVRIKSSLGGSVLRTFTVDNATTKTYLAADITTDFGSIPDDLTWDIRQVSGTGVVSPTRETTISL